MKKSKFMVIALAIATLFSTNTVSAMTLTQDDNYINYNNVEIKPLEKEKLLNLGFTESQIEMMDQEEFDNNKTLNGQVVAQTTKYYKSTIFYPDSSISTFSADESENDPIVYNEEITEEEYNNLPNETVIENTPALTRRYQPGYTETNGKKLTTTIIAVNGRYRLKADLVWKNVPVTRSNDVLAIGIDSTVSGIPNTKYVKQNWTYDNPCSRTCEYRSSTSASWKTDSAGYGAAFTLPSNTTCSIPSGDPLVLPTIKTVPVTELSSYMYFEINKLTSPINTINAYGDYAHAVTSVGISTSIGFSFGFSGVGIGITFSPDVSSKYDSMNTAQAYWSGLNW